MLPKMTTMMMMTQPPNPTARASAERVKPALIAHDVDKPTASGSAATITSAERVKPAPIANAEQVKPASAAASESAAAITSAERVKPAPRTAHDDVDEPTASGSAATSASAERVKPAPVAHDPAVIAFAAAAVSIR
jgi:hypothetical protein